MRLERLTRGHAVAAVAALVLLVVMAMTWYGTTRADLAHRVEATVNPNGAEGGEIGRNLQADARSIIAHDEKNAWHETRTIDRLLLVLLIVTIAAAIAGALFRAQGRRFEPPLTPAAVASFGAIVCALLVAYRIIQQPGANSVTTVKVAPFLALLALAAIGLGSASAFQREADWSAMRRAAIQPAEPDDED